METLLPEVFLVRSPVFELLASLFRLQSHEHLTKVQEVEAPGDFDLGLWVERVRKRLPAEMVEGLAMFFNHESYVGLTLCRLAWRTGTWGSLDGFLESVANMPADELFRLFLESGYAPSGAPGLESGQAIQHYIDRMNLPEKEKWRLAYLHLDVEHTRARFYDLLVRARTLYFDAEWDRLRELNDRSAVELARRIKNRGDLVDAFPYLRGVVTDHPDLTVVLAPSVFYHVDSMSSFDDDGSLYLTLYGIHFPNRRSLGPDELTQFLKMLADDTRLKIIKTLAAGDSFGYELAQKLRLSSSTISHHLSILQDMGIVAPTRHDNRVYYALNRDRLLGHLTGLTRELLR